MGILPGMTGLVGLTSTPFEYINSSTGTYTSSGSTLTANLPSTISNGNLLVIFAAHQPLSQVLSAPSGWSALFDVWNGSGTTPRMYGFYKVATGSEGATVALGFSDGGLGAGSAQVTIVQIGGRQSTPSASSTTGSSSTPNPPSLSLTGSAQTIWLAAAAMKNQTISAAPSGYSALISNAGANPQLYVAYLKASAATEDPGTFTANGSAVWVAATVGVR